MNFLPRLRRRLRTLFHRRAAETEMAEEMRFHLEQRTADFAAEGFSAEEARLAAQRKFGNTAALQESARDTFGWGALERFAQDLRLAARQLRRSPGFSLLAIVTLGLGIGANTSMFTVLNGIMLKPLPYADLDRLQQIHRVTAANPEGNHSPADFLAVRAAATEGFGELAALRHERVSLSDPSQPAQLSFAARTSANVFTLFGVVPQLGRTFTAAEEQPGRDRVVIISQRIWRTRYGSDPDILGRRIRVDGEPHEVIGVLPESFNDWRHYGGTDFFRPFEITPAFAADRTSFELDVIGRLRAGRTPAEGAAWISAWGARRAAEFPAPNAGSAWRSASLQGMTIGRSGGVTLPMLVALSGFVLLIACSNLANFLLARTLTRSREFALRGALGASRLQLLRPLLAESLLLSLAGGALALVVALWFRDWAAVRSTADNGEQVRFALDWAVLAWTFGAAVATSVGFGLAPALFALRLDLNEALKNGGRNLAGSRGHARFRQLLIVGQFAFAMILLAGAAMFIRGLDELHHRRSGWDSAQVVTGFGTLPAATYGDDAKLAAFHRLAAERLAALPGVECASLAGAAPFFDWPVVEKFVVDRAAPPEAGREPTAQVNSVSPRFFDTFAMRLVAGRTLLDRDNATAPRVLLVGETTARAFFGSPEAALGRRIAAVDGGAPQWAEIVGVVADFETVDPEPSPVTHRLYLPLAQRPVRTFELAVRARPDIAPSVLVEPIRTALAELDADLPVRRLQPADQNIHRTLYQLRVLRDMLGAFGVLGLALASIGIYGVISRTMAQRAGEFAIRLALGAHPNEIARLVFGTGVRLAVVGSLLGLVGAYGVTRLLTTAFSGIHANSALTLALTTALLVSVALLACWMPARRARRIDALAALRAD